MEKKKILFISHEASLSGAPILLLSILKKFKSSAFFDFDILVLKNGPLYKDFSVLTENIYLENNKNVHENFIKRNLNRIETKIYGKKYTLNQRQDLVKKISANHYDLVYGNTIASLEILTEFKKYNIPTAITIHELSFSLESIMPKELIVQKIKQINYIVCGSKAVGDNLVENYEVPENKISIIHAFVQEQITINQEKFYLKQKHEINESEFVIGIASAQELRKGTDLVPALVKKILQKEPLLKFKFVNLGGSENNQMVRCSKLDAKKLGVEDYIIYIEQNQYPNDYINLFDIFLLLSREDPFPLVMLSAAKLCKPIIAFEKSGGAEEFLDDQSGILVPYLDLDILAEKIISLLQYPEQMKQLGDKIKSKLTEMYSEEILIHKNIAFLQKILSDKS
ncbi:glycosyltransferase family 4 protein [Moheibacter sediminis]|uniref:Glycosyltransferase involved in cell wall bisynthesis n=1 Tax=Moheibacter sediminis TaxID=1434700 RepID=A0A1W1YX66_9FLAO|nr:glycosyltransferase family 4 protein [Moheibacter sediminis]SMC40769.1 Glycosyltransferase involved in cell wall bisynthesis [Moheibacter sediminis]